MAATSESKGKEKEVEEAWLAMINEMMDEGASENGLVNVPDKFEELGILFMTLQTLTNSRNVPFIS